MGINLDQEIPNFSTFWRFKEALSSHHLDERIFELINQQLQAKGLMVKKGTIVDASIIPSAGRALSDKKREELAGYPSPQIDTDAKSTRKGGWYYGVLDKAKRGQPLSAAQKKRNRKLSRVRAAVEHPFAWKKTKAGPVAMRAKNQARNRLRFMFGCMGWNLNRAGFLLEKSRLRGIGSSMKGQVSIKGAFKGLLKASGRGYRSKIDGHIGHCKKIRSTFSHEK